MVRWVIFFLAISAASFGQQTIEARIVDKETGEPIPFASIGIVGTSKGTSSNLNGQFSLVVSGPVSVKITCVGYESLIINSLGEVQLIELNPIATRLDEIFILSKAINPKKIVRKAFAGITNNYSGQSFLQKFFYRHYCKDDSVYGRLIEASVEVWKHQGYKPARKAAGQAEEIRVTQLRRSLDKTLMAQGHAAISVGTILQADVAGYQSTEKNQHLKFYEEVSNLKTDFENYSFTFNGITTYDGQEVYIINYRYKKDSVLTTSGYLNLPQATGSLFITTNTYAFVKTEDVRYDGANTIRTSAYYRKFANKHYPYHFIREGENHLSDGSVHTFHIELMSVEIRQEMHENFSGNEPSKEDLLKIPYDSAYWNSITILKTTPLEDAIIHDLGGGHSLNRQFYLYHQYEWSVSDGGKGGNEKFNWFKEYSKNKRALYLFFIDSHCLPYWSEIEQVKQLHKLYRQEIAFIFISVENDETKWKQLVSKYNLSSDGIVNYRIGENAALAKQYNLKNIPAFVLISKTGEVFDMNAKRPTDSLLLEDFKFLIEQAQEPQ